MNVRAILERMPTANETTNRLTLLKTNTEEKVLSFTRDQFAATTRNVMRRRLSYTIERKNTRFKIYGDGKTATVTSDVYETLTLKQGTVRGVSSEVAIVSLRDGRLLATSIESRTRFY